MLQAHHNVWSQLFRQTFNDPRSASAVLARSGSQFFYFPQNIFHFQSIEVIRQNSQKECFLECFEASEKTLAEDNSLQITKQKLIDERVVCASFDLSCNFLNKVVHTCFIIYSPALLRKRSYNKRQNEEQFDSVLLINAKWISKASNQAHNDDCPK